MEIRLRYFEGCPHWKIAQDRLREALLAEDMADVEPILERVETPQDAERLRFPGSPTILLDGRDPFAGATVAFGLTCRGLPDTGGSRRVTHTRAASSGPAGGLIQSRNERTPLLSKIDGGDYP